MARLALMRNGLVMTVVEAPTGADFDGYAVVESATAQPGQAFDGNAFDWPASPPPTQADLEGARADIDAAAGRARQRYITTAPGQSETYTAKYADAKAYLAAGSPSEASAYPWVAAESQATGQAPAQAAQTIKATGDAWNLTLGPAIEAARIGGKTALASLATLVELQNHVAQVVATLDAI